MPPDYRGPSGSPDGLSHNAPLSPPPGAVRLERDSLGEIEVPAARLWGAQTQRCLLHFPAGQDRFRWGRPVIRALAVVKKCAAVASGHLGRLEPEKVALIVRAAQEVIDGLWDAEFPLSVFQTGSGTQTNMNANEVIANRANQIAGAPLGSKAPIHPNDDVNRSQSSNDVFPTVMHLAAVHQIESALVPALTSLRDTFADKERRYAEVVMVGRTHLQDAAPIALGQVISGWRAQLDAALAGLHAAVTGLLELAIGGTAVGTGLNAPSGFGAAAAAEIADETGHPFFSAANKFSATSSHDALVATSAALRATASALFKIANDVRWYASGPRAGIGELMIPALEPGSSILPGKINPTECEAITQVAVQVFGNDHAIAFANSQGSFQLNTYKPVILHNVMESVSLLADSCRAFDVYCARGIEPDRARIREHLEGSLIGAAALSPHVGYDRASHIALTAQRERITLREAALHEGVSEREFDEWVAFGNMI